MFELTLALFTRIALNPYAGGSSFGQYGTHLRVLGESYPMNTNMTGFRCFFKNLCALLVL